MASINPVRITGLSGSGIDTEKIIKDMLVKNQEQVDKAKQNQQLTKWKQEIYRDIIKDSKSLYDKYFSMTSSSNLLSDKNYSSLKINISNSDVITATQGSGTDKINYNFVISQVAEPPKISISLESIKKQISSGANTITINGKDINVESSDSEKDIADKINKAFEGDGSIKATFNEMRGELIISGTEEGKNSKFEIGGDFIENIVSDTTTTDLKELGASVNGVYSKNGKNLEGEVVDPTTGMVVRTLDESKNNFTIDNISYNVNSVGESKLTSVVDSTNAVDNMKNFVKEYNDLLDNMYSLVIQKKSKDYSPLTEEQKKEMSEKEIELWNEKAKAGVLKNDDELRKFVDDLNDDIFGNIHELGFNLSDMGLTVAEDYNKRGQIDFDEEKFRQALEQNGDKVKEILVGSSNKKGLFEKVKDTLFEYAGSSTSILAKKSGIDKLATSANNLYSKEINEQEQVINRLIEKMKDRENQLYAQFANLEATLNKYNSQMNYFNQV